MSSHAAKVHSTLEGKNRENPDKITPNNHAHRTQTQFLASPLDVGVVGDGSDSLGGVALLGDEVTAAGANGLALQVDVDTLLLGLTLLDGVLLDTVDELLTGARVLNVLDADVDALLDVAVVDALVKKDTDRGLGDVVDNASLAVEDFVGHTVQRSVFCSDSSQTVGGSRFRSANRCAGGRRKFGCTDPF